MDSLVVKQLELKKRKIVTIVTKLNNVQIL